MQGVIVTYDHGDVPREITDPPFGANMAFRREVFERYGMFNPSLGPHGTTLMRGEDTEFCRRVLDAGECILYAPDAVVFHPVEPERARKAYFRSWYYQFGRRDVRLAPTPESTRRWLGVPRYVIRGLIQAGAAWATSVDSVRRFHYDLQCCRLMGQIHEHRQIDRSETWGARSTSGPVGNVFHRNHDP
jgi:hypothetical protein